jgi:hypothetical protein
MLIPGKPTISSKCASSACVEVTLLESDDFMVDGGVQVRDAKKGGESLVISAGDWTAFLRVYAR